MLRARYRFYGYDGPAELRTVANRSDAPRTLVAVSQMRCSVGPDVCRADTAQLICTSLWER